LDDRITIKKLFCRLKRRLFRKSNKAYLKHIELLAKEVVDAASDEFEVYIDVPKSNLEKKITKLAKELRYTHEHDDGCCGKENCWTIDK
jgi:hypothetical protein